MLPWPHLVQGFAVAAASAPQFGRGIWELEELDAAMLDLAPGAFACTAGARDPRMEHLSGFGFAVSFLLLPCVFDFAVSFLLLP